MQPAGAIVLQRDLNIQALQLAVAHCVLQDNRSARQAYAYTAADDTQSWKHGKVAAAHHVLKQGKPKRSFIAFRLHQLLLATADDCSALCSQARQAQALVP